MNCRTSRPNLIPERLCKCPIGISFTFIINITIFVCFCANWGCIIHLASCKRFFCCSLIVNGNFHCELLWLFQFRFLKQKTWWNLFIENVLNETSDSAQLARSTSRSHLNPGVSWHFLERPWTLRRVTAGCTLSASREKAWMSQNLIPKWH